MFVLIVGGGRIGSHLAKLLLELGHEVRVIEGRAAALESLHRELPTQSIFEGDGTDPQRPRCDAPTWWWRPVRTTRTTWWRLSWPGISTAYPG